MNTLQAVKWDNVNHCYSGEHFTVEAKEADTPRGYHSQTGYGSRIPTSRMIRYNGKWRRVYVCIWSNSGTAYVGKPRAWDLIISD